MNDVRVPPPAEIEQRLALLREEQRQLRRLLRISQTAARAEEARGLRQVLEGKQGGANDAR
jgi:hypothetical protein